MVLVGQDLVVDHVNAACRAITRPDVDPIGQRFEDIWPHGDPVVVPVLRNVLATGAGLSVEDYPLRQPAGSPLLGPGEARAVAARPGGFLCVGDLRRLGGAARGGAGRGLGAAARRRDAALDAIADGLILYDRRGEIVRMNETATRLLGYAADEAHPDLAERFAVLRVYTPDGRLMRLEDTPVRARSGARRSAASTRAWSTRAGRSGPASAAPVRGADHAIVARC